MFKSRKTKQLIESLQIKNKYLSMEVTRLTNLNNKTYDYSASTFDELFTISNDLKEAHDYINILEENNEKLFKQNSDFYRMIQEQQLLINQLTSLNPSISSPEQNKELDF